MQTLFLNPNNGLFTTFHGNFATKTALPLQYISLRPGSYKRRGRTALAQPRPAAPPPRMDCRLLP